MKQNSPQISIIIPVLNEEAMLAKVINYLRDNSTPENIKEILVVDGGSIDATLSIASKHEVILLNSQKGRAKQMNLGAKMANGEILYFLHVDTLPPKNFDQSIVDAISKKNKAGCFQLKFDSKSMFLQFFAWFSRINIKLCRGGDQSLFITKKLFQNSGGFNENYMIYEDNEFIGRLYKMVRFKILPNHVKTSARKYEKLGKFNLQYHFAMIHLQNYLGAGPEKLYEYYKRNIAI